MHRGLGEGGGGVMAKNPHFEIIEGFNEPAVLAVP